MTVERSKRRSLLALTFIAKSTSKNLLIRTIKSNLKKYIHQAGKQNQRLVHKFFTLGKQASFNQSKM